MTQPLFHESAQHLLLPVPTVTLADCQQQAQALLLKGTRAPSVKFAIWNSALSTRQPLSKNCALARLLARFVDTELPAQETLFLYLAQATRFLNRHQHFPALYSADQLDRQGLLDQFLPVPERYPDQVLWRDRLYTLFSGHGLGWKTASMVAFLLAPTTSHLVLVDCHVIARLGLGLHSSPKDRATYLEIERTLHNERDSAGFQDVPGIIWHWYTWEYWRQLHGKSLATEGAESHLGLSCRWY